VKILPKSHPIEARLHPGGECCSTHSQAVASNKKQSPTNDEYCPIEAYRKRCIAALKDAGMRVTAPRIAVIDCIASSAVPLSAPAIFELLKNSSQNVGSSVPDKVSVYRVLEALHDLQLAHKVLPSGEFIACLHLDCAQAYHVVTNCMQCEAVQERDLPLEVVADLIRFLAEQYSFRANSHLLQIDGVCRDCSSK
jgi:Fur family transcriptional regulator, ferric uptake regulator